jgi:hypothetical protein
MKRKILSFADWSTERKQLHAWVQGRRWGRDTREQPPLRSFCRNRRSKI